MRKIYEKIKNGMLKEVIRELLWIYQYGLKYKGSILWYMLLGILGTVMGLCGSVMSKYIIDAVTGFDSEGIIPAAIAYVCMQLFVIVSNAWTGRISAKIEVKVDQEIRADVYDKIMEADWEAMSEFHSGDLLNRVDNDVSSVSASVIGWVPNFVTKLIQFVGTLGIILYYDPTLAVLALFSAPISIAVSRVLTRRMRLYNKKIRKVSSEVMIFNEESFQNIQMIKSFGLTEVYGKKLRKVQEEFRDAKLDYNKFSIYTSSFMSLVGTLISIACFGWSVYRLWSGHITYGTMTLFLQMASSLTAAFSSLVNMVPSAISAATAAGRIMAVTELPKEKREHEEEVKMLLEKGEGITITANQIDFRYSTGKKVLEQADFVARPGEIVALVGPSGEGKTTMLRILLGIVSVQEGSVTVYGKEEKGKLPISASTRSLFSYVPQNNIMFAGTIAENLRIVKKDATDEEINQVLKLACAYDFVHKIPTGIHSRIKEKGGGFSEGQVQRLAIARAMLSDAPILLLDEATSALDIETERNVLRNIMSAKENRTCIVTTHRPGVIKMCDRIYKISDGSIQIVEGEKR